MPSIRFVHFATALVALLGLQGVVVAQGPGAGSELGLGTRIGIRFGVALLVNLLLGGALVAIGPEYARSSVGAIQDDPVTAFGWGLLVGIGVPILLALLAVTIVGLVVAIPGALLLIPVSVVGNAVTVAWVGSALVGTNDTVGLKAAGSGALALAAVYAIPVLGNLVTAVLGFFGLGAVGRGLYRGWQD